jgi:hypothetical protein
VKLALTRSATRVSSLHSYHVNVEPAATTTICEEFVQETLEDQMRIKSRGSFPSEDDRLERSIERATYAAKRQKRLMAKLRTPAWLSLFSNALEVCCYKAGPSWMFTAQTYRVVSQDSPIMIYAQMGDIQGIKELFQKKLASPYDRDMCGYTVLGVSIFNTKPLSYLLAGSKANFSHKFR